MTVEQFIRELLDNPNVKMDMIVTDENGREIKSWGYVHYQNEWTLRLLID